MDDSRAAARLSWTTWLGWLLAVTCALATGYATFLSASLRTESVLQRESAELADIEARSLRQSLEAERIIARQQIAHFQNAGDPRRLRLSRIHRVGEAAEVVGVLAWSPARRDGQIQIDGLAATTADEEYAIWVFAVDGRDPQRAGGIPVAVEGVGRGGFRVPDGVAEGARVAITRERVGTQKPAGQPVAEARL